MATMAGILLLGRQLAGSAGWEPWTFDEGSGELVKEADRQRGPEGKLTGVEVGRKVCRARGGNGARVRRGPELLRPPYKAARPRFVDTSPPARKLNPTRTVEVSALRILSDLVSRVGMGRPSSRRASVFGSSYRIVILAQRGGSGWRWATST